MSYFSHLCSIFMFWLIPSRRFFFLSIRTICASFKVTALKLKKMPFLIGSTHNMVHVICFSFVLNFHVLAYSFAQIVILVTKNNLCKFRSHSSKIGKKCISNRQHPQHGACYMFLVCAQFSCSGLFLCTDCYSCY